MTIDSEAFDLHPETISTQTNKNNIVLVRFNSFAATNPPFFINLVLALPLLLQALKKGGSVKDNRVKIFAAEAIGTMVLVLGGVGTAVLATGAFPTEGDPINVGALGVSIAFGLSLLVMVYSIGSISGCHINPAVTLGLVIAKKVKGTLLPVYWVAQITGAIIGALFLKIIASGVRSWNIDEVSFGTNGFEKFSPGGFSLGAVGFTEVLFTAIFVLVVIMTTRKDFPAGFVGVSAGLALTLVHLITIPVSNTSVNPARSIGPALIKGGDVLSGQLWAFIVFPLIGAIIAGLVAIFVLPESKVVTTNE